MRPILGIVFLALAIIAIGLSVVAANSLRALGSASATIPTDFSSGSYPILNLFGGDLLWPKEEAAESAMVQPAQIARQVQVRIYTVGLAGLFLIAMGLLLLFAGAKENGLNEAIESGNPN